MTTFELAELRVHAALEILRLPADGTRVVFDSSGGRVTVREQAELFLIRLLQCSSESEPPK